MRAAAKKKKKKKKKSKQTNKRKCKMQQTSDPNRYYMSSDMIGEFQILKNS